MKIQLLTFASIVALVAADDVVAAATSPSFTRSAHWVIRTSNLNKTIEFTKQVLGMRVLRHEV